MEEHKCRICLNEGMFESIFKISGSLMISTQIMSLANVAIYPNDGLPSTICLTCTSRLDNCIKFVEQCEKSDLHLRSKCIKIEDEHTTNDVRSANKIVDSINSTSYSEEINKFSFKSSVSDLCIDTESNAERLPSESISIKNEKQTNNMINKKSQKQQCFTCGKVMSSRFRLKTHLYTHTGERPFSCPHCNKSFSLAQNLKVHLRIHTGEKPFRCSVCGDSFAHSAGLAVHRRKHTGQKPYQCILCPRSFRTVGHLQYHIRRHTGAKNFECQTCGRAFITRSDLKQHLVSHSGEKSHVCCICGMRLTRASHLKRHIRIVHGNEEQTPQNFCKAEIIQKKNIINEDDQLGST